MTSERRLRTCTALDGAQAEKSHVPRMGISRNHPVTSNPLGSREWGQETRPCGLPTAEALPPTPRALATGWSCSSQDWGSADCAGRRWRTFWTIESGSWPTTAPAVARARRPLELEPSTPRLSTSSVSPRPRMCETWSSSAAAGAGRSCVELCSSCPLGPCPRWCSWTRRGNPGWRLVEAPGFGHHVLFTQPQLVADEILRACGLRAGQSG